MKLRSALQATGLLAPLVFSTGAAATNGYYSHNADRIRIAMDGKWVLDGELYAARLSDGPVTISNGGDVTFVRV